MSSDNFFSAQDLDMSETDNRVDFLNINSKVTEIKKNSKSGFFSGSELEDDVQELVAPDLAEECMETEQTEHIDEMKLALEKIRQESNFVTVPKVKKSNSVKERVVVRFVWVKKNLSYDLDLPLSITSNDLILGLNEAYQLGINSLEPQQCYLTCENPIALLKGNRTLADCGVRDGSLISFNR